MALMAQPTKNKKSGIYYTRLAVPKDIRDSFGRAEVKCSLNTRDPKEAARLHAVQYDTFNAEFDAFRRRMLQSEAGAERGNAKAQQYDQLSRLDISILCARFYNSEYEKITRSESFGVELMAHYSLLAVQLGIWGNKGRDIDPELAANITRAENRCVLLQNDIDDESIAVTYIPAKELNDVDSLRDVMGEYADELLAEHGYNVDSDSPQYQLLLQGMASRVPKLQQVADETYSNNFELSSPDSHATKQTSKELASERYKRSEHSEQCPVATQSSSTEVHRVLPLFERLSESRLTLNAANTKSVERTLKDYTTTINRFNEFIGQRCVTSVTRADISQFRELLLKLPSRATKAVRALPLAEQVAVADKQSLERISPSSVKKQLHAVGALFEYAFDIGLIDVNPVHGTTKSLSAVIESKSGEEKQFTKQELVKIFQSSIYSDGYRGKTEAYGEAVYWLPLLAYYTGARVEELAQLYVSDVKETDSVHYLHITDDAEDKSVKNKGSRRKVPLHADLISLGFLQYVRSVEQDGRVFPKLSQNSDGRYATNMSKWIGKYFRDRLNVGQDKSPLHAFRHTAKTMARSVGIHDDVSRAIMGHSKGDVAESYGHYEISLLKDSIDKLPSAPLQQFVTVS